MMRLPSKDASRSDATAGALVLRAPASKSIALFRWGSSRGKSAIEPWFLIHSKWAKHSPSVYWLTCRSNVCSEDKIDDISRKLDRICVAVDSYNATPPVGGSWRSARPSLAAQEAPSSAASTVAPTEEDAPDEELGGELSLTAHAAFATDYVQQAMRGKDASPEMTTSLEALRRVVGRDTTRGMAARETHPQLLEPRFSTGDMRLPPIQFSMSYLQKLRSESPNSHGLWCPVPTSTLASARLRFHWTWELESVGQFVEYLLPVYSGGATIAEMITVNAGLYRLFGGCVNEETQEMPKNELKAHAEACRQNLESILARLPFNLPSNYDYVLALFNAVSAPGW